MIHRAITLKDALALYQDHFVALGELSAEDCLTTADWSEIVDLLALLKPLAEA